MEIDRLVIYLLLRNPKKKQGDFLGLLFMSFLGIQHSSWHGPFEANQKLSFKTSTWIHQRVKKEKNKNQRGWEWECKWERRKKKKEKAKLINSHTHWWSWQRKGRSSCTLLLLFSFRQTPNMPPCHPPGQVIQKNKPKYLLFFYIIIYLSFFFFLFTMNLHLTFRSNTHQNPLPLWCAD